MIKTGAIFVDVDGTLLFWESKAGIGTPEVNRSLVKWIRQQKANGKTIVVWSRGGVQHVKTAIRLCGIEDLVDFAVPKPDLCVDDGGPDRFTGAEIVHPNNL